jgi:molybdate transport system substrate-binding protein
MNDQPTRAAGRRRLARVLLLVALVTLSVPAGAHALTVYAAASLRDAFPQIQPATYNFAGSNALQLQIERGAPADVFASASPQEALALFNAGRCTRPVTFATNVVVLLVPEGNPGRVRSVYSLREGGRRIAIGAPGVPIGDYTRTLLARLRLSSILSSNTVSQEPNVTGITSKVALGSADAGFAYVTDGRIVADRVKAIRLPSWAQPPVQYRICAVKRPGAETAGANAFIRRVVGSRGRRILSAGGFGLPPRG